jgi:SAM-dependent methyltransferase
MALILSSSRGIGQDRIEYDRTRLCPPIPGGAGGAFSVKLYSELASWWPLLSPPSHYVEEAADLIPRLGLADGSSMLELGCGGGSLAFHLRSRYRMTLTDISPGMLEASAAVNPGCEHLAGDMRTLRLGRRFDAVLIHDAIMYQTDEAGVRAALETAATHLRKGGVIAVLPDCVRETFAPGSEHGGEDDPDGRGLRYLAWSWDPDPSDTVFLVDYAFLLRGRDGAIAVVHDRHVEGVFPRASWLEWLREAGMPATSALDPWQRDVFIGTRE